MAVNVGGRVISIARSPTTIYLGGNFNAVGPVTGQGVPVNRTTGEPLADYPVVSGTIKAVLADGRGGWYIGGAITRVRGEARSALADIGADGQVAPWAPAVAGVVQAMALSGDTLYLGGWFSEVCGQPRSYLAAVNTSGGLLDWDPRPNSVMRSLVTLDGRLFVAGSFTQIGGATRQQLAQLDAATGAATEWRADANQRVISLAVANHVLYAGGWFTTVGGQPRQGLAAITTDSAKVLDWAPTQDGAIRTLKATDDGILVGGAFDHIVGEPRPCFAILSQYGVDWSTPPPAPPDRAALAQNVPNPARASTSVRFTLARSGAVTLTIHDLAGRRIARPIRDEWRAPGVHDVEIATGAWPPGIYYYRLSAPGVDVTRRMAVVR